ncbi:MAG: hypothetical protein ABSH09_30295 [Bryobacteraceae bacterium]|jgi:hypothetical protein
MSELSASELAEKEWAKAHFRDFLLHRLDLSGEDRVMEAIALIPGLAYDLDEAEGNLIEEWIDGHMPAYEIEIFERHYVNGTVDNLAKVRVYQALRSPELKKLGEEAEPKVVPIRRPFPRSSILIAAAAAVLVLFSVLQYTQYLQIASLKIELAKLRNQPGPANVEQQAGMTPDGGLPLDAGDSGKTLSVPTTPVRLSWSLVPDYRGQYRIRVGAAGGREQTSPLLTPANNSVAYTLNDPAALALPWQVTILAVKGAEERVLARYTIVKR